MASPDLLTEHLVQITSNLAAYVEEQAQMIARPKIEAAERAWGHRLDETQQAHAVREQRSADLIAELHRQIAGLQRFQERARLKETRLRAVADDLEARDLHEAATALRNALNLVGNMASPGRREVSRG